MIPPNLRVFMRDLVVIPSGVMLPVKEESPAETGISDVPVFTGSRESAQSTPASTFTNGSQGLKPEGDYMLAAPSAAAATIASVTMLSDAMTTTPFVLPATPPPQYFDTIDYSAKPIASADAAPTARRGNERMNDTPSDSASEPAYEQYPPAARAASLEARPDSPVDIADTAGTSLNFASSDIGSEHADFVQLPETAETLAASFVSSTDANSSSDISNAVPSIPASLPAPRTEQDTSLHINSAEDTIASRRPMRVARQPKPVLREARTPARPATKPIAKSAPNLALTPAATPPSKSASKSDTKSAVAPTERRTTRLSGLPVELSVPQPALGKRRRSEPDRSSTSDLPRELRRLQDTKEFSHVDEQPIVHTVWSNGKYVPANAAGEPLPDKNAAKKAKVTRVADAQGSPGEVTGQSSGNKGKAGSGVGEDEEQPDVPRTVQKRVKKWLNKGLYAGQSMPENPAIGLTASERKALANMPELSKKYPPNKTLPMPIFNGFRMLIQGRDFKMPFDVFNPLPPGQPKPIKYGRFSKNRFVGEAHAIWKKNPHYDDFQSKCVCKPETGCDEDCQNRIMLYECNDMICNVGSERCSNREFQRLAERTASKNPFHIGVEVFKTPDRGHGIRANRSFRPGQIIMEYIGEIITEEESDRRMNELYKDNACYYLMSFDQSLIIDGTSGSIARFVNHSCSPNCRMIKWIVSGQPRIALFAGDRPILTGEELTYDYNFDPYSNKNVQSCLCGSENCRGVLGPRKSEKAVSKAAAEKAAAEKAKSKPAKATNKNKSTNQKKLISSKSKPSSKAGPGKRKLDAYSMDDDDEPMHNGQATKKIRISAHQKRGRGRPRKDEPEDKASKVPTPRRVTTTKAALEALAAGAAKEARLAKAAKAARAARAARAAKAAESVKAAEASKKAKLAKLSKVSKVVKSANASRATKAAKATKATKAAKANKTSKTTKTTGATKAATGKSPKAMKAVKAAKSVKVVKTAKGLKATKVSNEARATKATKTTAGKATKSLGRKPATPPTKVAKVAKSVKFVKPAKAVTTAKSPRGRKPKVLEMQRVATPPAADGMDDEPPPQATPMAQAVAKAAKEAAKAANAAKTTNLYKGAKTTKLVKTSRPQAKLMLKASKTKTTAVVALGSKPSGEAGAPVKRGRGRPRLVPTDASAKTVVKTVARTAIKTAKTVPAPTAVAEVSGEAEELAAQLNMEVAADAAANVITKAGPRATITGRKAGKSARPTAIQSAPAQEEPNKATSDPPRRRPGRPRKVMVVDVPNTESPTAAPASVTAVVETETVAKTANTSDLTGFASTQKVATTTAATEIADIGEDLLGGEETAGVNTLGEKLPTVQNASANGVERESAEDVIHVAPSPGQRD